MRKLKQAFCAVSALTLALAVPAVAQEDSAADGAEAARRMAQVFTADPLTAEQQARLPAAENVVGRIFPPGTYMKMMGENMQPMMDAIMGQVGALPIAQLVRMTGLPESEISGLGEGTLAEVMAILDPVYERRQKLATATTMDWMAQLMDQMEPSFRAGLSRAYAVRFEEAELRELSAFFDTPAGGHYAAESMLIMMDPQVMSAMGELMPRLMDTMPQMIADMQQKMDTLPKARTIEELSDEERARLSELLGIVPVEPQ